MKLRNDLTNQKFDRLTVIKPTDDRDRDGNVVWLCECECGNLVKKSGRILSRGEVHSCGCLRAEQISSQIKLINMENRLFAKKGTDVRTLNQKLAKNNTSGYKGVIWCKDRDRWRAYITFQRKHYSLGSYSDIKDAAQARKIAEEKLHGDFLAWFQETYPERYAKLRKKKMRK